MAATRTSLRPRAALKRAGDAVIGMIALGLIHLLRLTNPDWLSDTAAAAMRRVGPWLRENDIARGQIAAAFPDKSPADVEQILRGSWENLGRMGAEFIHLDRLWDYQSPDKPGRFDIAPHDLEGFFRLAEDGKPALIFAAHLGNWELPAISAHSYGVDSALLYRGPNIAAIDRWITQTRTELMGRLIPTGLGAPVELAEALERGAHVGMLVDQYYVRGVPVTFFGRPTRANPLIARLARHVDCPIHGVRLIRLPGHRYRGDITEAIAPARDAGGKMDIAGTMQIIMNVVEGWVREHPEQWLWQHRRWRPEDRNR
ncbi:MAG: lipid A biosynthesis lauroyl acyltransferase [Pseudolabrys sp.]